MRFSVSTTKCTQEVTPVTLDHSAVSELLEAFRTAEGIDLVRELTRLVMQESDRDRSRRGGRRPLRTSQSTGERT